jgi:hypothetical protein
MIRIHARGAWAALAAVAVAGVLVPAAGARADEISPVADLQQSDNSKAANFGSFGFAGAAVRFNGTTMTMKKYGNMVRVEGTIAEFRCSQWHAGDLDMVLYQGDTALTEIPKVYSTGDGCRSCQDAENEHFYATLKGTDAFDQADRVQLVSRNFKVCPP